MSNKIEDMKREGLQQMLDSYSSSVEGITEGYLDKITALLAYQKEAGVLGGQTNKDSGWASQLGKLWGRNNMIEFMNKETKCEHCGEITNLGNIIQYHHGGKCEERNKFEQSIVEAYEKGMSISMLTQEFERDRASIYNILIKNNANIRVNQILSEDDVWDILVQLENKVPRKELVKLYGVSKPTIDHIAQGRSWPEVQERFKNR